MILNSTDVNVADEMLNYSEEICSEFYHENIEDCRKSHNLFERQFHPNCYLRKQCKRKNHFSLYEEQQKRNGMG